ncbi:CST complex subunit STN1 isoform X2 [Solea solea]|uniref:CST complex subunit STN1 isoform X2 n=1 Tax=Solea solea TaxID=90069 RepID=UPI00272B33C1|nr:CST complex subunit STN1 isoform X2 [Solea solea]
MSVFCCPRLCGRRTASSTRVIQVPTQTTQRIYFYNSHPIYKVDVLGTVVYKREREDFFCYGVDDGTGVINCLCWKNDRLKEEEDPNKSEGKPSDAAQGAFNPIIELKKLQQAQKNLCCLEIGELLRVRGPVKTSRQQREIMASTYYKVNDPVMTAQIAWMMEVPQLYRLCYDKPLQHSATSVTALTPISKAKDIIQTFFKQRSVSVFRPYDVQDLLQPLISCQTQTTSVDEEPVAGPSVCQQLRQLLRETLEILHKEGIIYRKVKSQDEVYQVTAQDKDLLITVKDIIREDTKREKYAEKGCHILHILSAVRQRFSLNVNRAALERVLKSLECNSDIISTSGDHYTMF